MTIGEAIQRVKSLYSKGVHSDDSRLSARHIYNKLRTLRSKLLYEKVNKKQFISSINYNILPCVELVKAEIHECPCIPPLGCCIWKSKYPLPTPISGIDGHIIRSVTTLDGSVVFSETTWLDKKYGQYDKYTSKKPDYYISNNHLYITDKNDAIVVRVELLLEDPFEGENFIGYCPTTVTGCIAAQDREFHLDNSMFDVLVEFAAQELISMFNQNQEDSSNNTKDNPEQTTK